MDDSRKGNRNAAIALVVRQFAPSRIERQLLAQVFDLVCQEQQPRISSSTGRCADHQLPIQSDHDWSLDGSPATPLHRAGRAAS